jgi:hypothetical protein
LLKQKNEPTIVGLNGDGMNVWNAGEKWIVLDCDNLLEDGADTMVKSDMHPTNT